MIDGSVVVDAVVHPYNLAPENQNPAAHAQLEAVYGAHVLATGDAHREHMLTRDEFFSDVPFDAIGRALFVESPVDYAVIHALPNLGFARSYVTDPTRAAAYRDRYPQRFSLYATIDTADADRAVEQLAWQVKELRVDSLKLYPAFFYDDQAEGWRLDGPGYGLPLLQAAEDLGIRNVAIHKALWLPPAPPQAFDIDDLSDPLERFSSMNFSMVHAGTAFLAQTCELLRRHHNLFATLESTFAYIVVRPDVFARSLGMMLQAGGSDRLLYASGANLSHPAPLLDAFAGYELPAPLVEEHGYPQLSAADRAKIIGGNAMRMHDLSPEAIVRTTADDEFATARAAGPARPWSLLRSGSPR
jgi:predicted TIM-barrel fold metal-dependent hydrolase